MKHLVRILLWVAVLLPFQNAFSEEESNGTDGTYLLGHCRHYLAHLNTGDEKIVTKHTYSIAYCQGYVDSLRNVTAQVQISVKNDLFKVCMPAQARNDQIARVVTNYLIARPDLLHWNSGTVALMSLMEAFPCKN